MEEGEELTPTGRKKRPPRSMDLGNIFNPELDPSLEDLPRGRTTRGSRNSASSKVAARAEKGAASATKQGIGATASTKHEGSSGNERTSPKTDPTAEKSTLKAADEVVEDAPAARSPRVSERGAGTLETGIESPDAMRVDQGEPPEGDPTVQPTDAGDVGPMAFEPLGTETIDDLYA